MSDLYDEKSQYERMLLNEQLLREHKSRTALIEMIENVKEKYYKDEWLSCPVCPGGHFQSDFYKERKALDKLLQSIKQGDSL